MLFPKGSTLDVDPKQCRNALETRRVRSCLFAGSFAARIWTSLSILCIYYENDFSDFFACISAGEQALPHWITESISAYTCLRDAQSCPAVSLNDTFPMEAAH